MVAQQRGIALEECLKLPRSKQKVFLNDLVEKENELKFRKFLDDLLQEKPDISAYPLLKTFVNSKNLLPSEEVKQQIKKLLLHTNNSFENIDELVKDEEFFKKIFNIWDEQRKAENIQLNDYNELSMFITSKRLQPRSLISDIRKILAQYPEVTDDRLAIDIDESEFSSIKSKMDAIIDDINNDRIPSWRYHELLYINLYINYFNQGDDEELKKSIESRTFIAYAIPKIKNLHVFFSHLSNSIGVDRFKSYLELDNYSSGKILSTLKLYLENHGNFNLAERQIAYEFPYIEDLLNSYTKANQNYAVNIDHINTHENSVHSSADKSHIEGFKRLLEICEKQNIPLGEIKESYTTLNARSSVQFTKTNEWKQFVQSELFKLHQKIKTLLNLSDAELFEKYVRYMDVEQYKTKSLAELNDEEKEKFQKKIQGLRFKASSAERYMSSMINNHKIDGSGYPYETNEDILCGLNMEEMVAIAYNMSKDKEHYRDDVNEETAFLMLISGNSSGLYDMKRGYDTDHGRDNPDEDTFPNVHDIDSNRCRGGGVNSLANAVAFFHKSYEVKLVTRETLENEIRKIYQEIINANLEEITKLLANDKNAKLTWSSTGKIKGEVREFLELLFLTEHRENFLNEYTNTTSIEVVNSAINQALDSIKIPDQLKEEFSIEKISNEDMYEMIANDVLPILHISENGYESTINYLSRQEGHENLVQELFDKANKNLMINESTVNPRAIEVLSFLAKSNLPDQFNFKLDDKVKNPKLREKGVHLRDIAILKSHEMRSLFTSEDIIDDSINYDHQALFWLYATKAGFTENELKTAYGATKQTPLIYSAKYPSMRGIVKTIFETAKNYHAPFLKHILITRDRFGNTALHEAVYSHDRGRAVKEKDFLKTLLTTKDTYGNAAPKGYKVEIINTILEVAKSDPDLLKHILMAENLYTTTALQDAYNTGRTEAINAILYVVKNDPDIYKHIIMVDATKEEKSICEELAKSIAKTAIDGRFANKELRNKIKQSITENLLALNDCDSTKHIFRDLVNPENARSREKLLKKFADTTNKEIIHNAKDTKGLIAAIVERFFNILALIFSFNAVADLGKLRKGRVVAEPSKIPDKNNQIENKTSFRDSILKERENFAGVAMAR